MKGFIKPNKVIDENSKDKTISYRVAVSLGRNQKTKKYEYIWKTVPGNKKSIAERALRDLLHDRDLGKLQKPGKDTLGGYLDQ